jgi:uncharacterized lipoprotein YajG
MRLRRFPFQWPYRKYWIPTSVQLLLSRALMRLNVLLLLFMLAGCAATPTAKYVEPCGGVTNHAVNPMYQPAYRCIECEKEARK